jgi:hypothetical protein
MREAARFPNDHKRKNVMHRHRIVTLSAALMLAGASAAFAQSGSSGGASGGGTSGGAAGGTSSGTAGGAASPGTAGSGPSRLTPTQQPGGVSGPTVRAPSSNPSAVQPPTVTGQPSSNPSAAQPPTVAQPSTRPGCNPSQQAGGPTIAGTGAVGTASTTGGGVTARQDNQVDRTMGSGSPQTPTSNPRTPATNAEGLATGTPGTTTGARSGGTVDTGTPRIANDPSLGSGRTVQTNPGSVGISSVSGTPGTPSAQSPGASIGQSPSAAPRSGSVATGC